MQQISIYLKKLKHNVIIKNELPQTSTVVDFSHMKDTHDSDLFKHFIATNQVHFKYWTNGFHETDGNSNYNMNKDMN